MDETTNGEVTNLDVEPGEPVRLADRHETRNYVRFTGGGGFGRGSGARLTVYLTHGEDVKFGSPDHLTVIVRSGS